MSSFATHYDYPSRSCDERPLSRLMTCSAVKQPPQERLTGGFDGCVAITCGIKTELARLYV